MQNAKQETWKVQRGVWTVMVVQIMIMTTIGQANNMKCYACRLLTLASIACLPNLERVKIICRHMQDAQ